jgi:hypothetical protein
MRLEAAAPRRAAIDLRVRLRRGRRPGAACRLPRAGVAWPGPRTARPAADAAGGAGRQRTGSGPMRCGRDVAPQLVMAATLTTLAARRVRLARQPVRRRSGWRRRWLSCRPAAIAATLPMPSACCLPALLIGMVVSGLGAPANLTHVPGGVALPGAVVASRASLARRALAPLWQRDYVTAARPRRPSAAGRRAAPRAAGPAATAGGACPRTAGGLAILVEVKPVLCRARRGSPPGASPRA